MIQSLHLRVIPSLSNLNPTSPFFQNRRLILSYIPFGLQIWDCSDPGAFTEVFNLNFSDEELGFDVGRAVYATLLSSTVNRSNSVRNKSTSFKEDRPFRMSLVFVPLMG